MWRFLALVACSPKPGPVAAPAPTPDAADLGAQRVVTGELGASLDGWLTRFEPWALSAVVLVAKDDEVVLRAGYGAAVRGEGGRPLTPDTPLAFGSLSKPLTATAVLALAADGRLSLADPVSRFFPDAPAAIGATTVEQLLTHTSGLPYLPPDFVADVPREAVMAEVLGLPLASPGTWAYSSPGYTLLAGVLEAATGRSFEDVLRAEVLDPAGARGIGFFGEERWAAAPRVHSYTDGADEGSLAEFPALAKGVGAGTLAGTVDDLYRVHTALRTGALLPPEGVERAFSPLVSQGRPNQAFGHGWNVYTSPRGPIVAHAGDLGGYNTDLRWYPDRGLLLVLLSNAREGGVGWREAVMNDLSLRVAGEPHLEPPEVVEMADEELARWAGRYALPDGTVDARVEEGGLVLTTESRSAMALLAGTSPELAPRAAELDARTARVVEAAAHGRADPVREALSPSLPYDGVAESLAAERADREARLGPLVAVEVVGTAVRSAQSAETWFRYRHARGAELGRCTWVGEEVMGLDVGLPEPMPTRFLPSSPVAAVAFDPFARSVVGVELTQEGLRFADGTFAPRAG